MRIKLLSCSKEPSFQNIRRSIITIFGLVLLFAIFLVAGINVAVNKHDYDSKIINLAGRQRMLSQRIAKSIFFLQERNSKQPDISEDAELWNTIHFSLQHGNVALNIPKSNNTTVDSILRDISPFQQNLYLITKQINLSSLSHNELELISEWEAKFLEGMDLIVGILQKDLEKNTSYQKYIISFLTFLFMVFMWFLYQLLVKPVLNSVRALSEEKERQYRHFRSILENTSDLIWTIDNNYKLVAHNSVFAKRRINVVGKEPRTGENVLDENYFLESWNKTKDYYNRALSGISFLAEIEHERNGEKTYYELSFNPIYDDNACVTGCSVYQRDISKRRSALVELKESEKSLSEAQRIANIGNWDWNIPKNKIRWSEQLYILFGKDPKTFNTTYESLIELIHPDDRANFDNNIRECIEMNKPHEISHRILLEDGSIKYVHHKGKVFYDKDMTPIRMAGTTQDITLMENAKQRILQQYRELQNFVYIISHNVRGPITTLLSLMDLLGENKDQNKDDIILLISNTVEKLDGTIKDLNHALSLKNIARGDFEEVNLKEIIEYILILIAEDIKNSHTTIEYNFDKAPTVFGMKSYFTNIFYNLVMNALKYKSDSRDPYIEIFSNPNAIGGVEIVFSDNGMGMKLTEEKRKKIFDMYGKLSGSSSGKGLGLYLVKTQLDTMNGSIHVESKPNKGTVFTIDLLLNSSNKAKVINDFT